MSAVRDKVWEQFSLQCSRYSSRKPKDIRNDYIQVLCGMQSSTDFVKEQFNEGTTLQKVLPLLESQKYSMFSLTSCGWFFSDIAGIEPVQNMAYALESITLLPKEHHEGLLQILKTELETAESNNEKEGNGREILENRVVSRMITPRHVAAVGILRKLLGKQGTSCVWIEYG